MRNDEDNKDKSGLQCSKVLLINVSNCMSYQRKQDKNNYKRGCLQIRSQNHDVIVG